MNQSKMIAGLVAGAVQKSEIALGKLVIEPTKTVQPRGGF